MGRISIFESFSWFVFREGRKACCLRIYLGNLNLIVWKGFCEEKNAMSFFSSINISHKFCRIKIS
jgi:hypothetical protein